MMKNTLYAGIIGAGSIGGLIDSPKNHNTASHAHAYVKQPLCKLSAICDPNQENIHAFQSRWGKVTTYTDTQKLFEKETLNVLSIASPTSLHIKHLEDALYVKSIQHILCEKPITSSLEELNKLTSKLRTSDKKILINLIRRYSPKYIELSQLFAKKQWGNVLSFKATFNKGLLHNGIHALGVLSHLLGTVSHLEPLHVKEKEGDILGTFFLTCKEGKGIVEALDVGYSLFEITLWCEKGKVIIDESGSCIHCFTKKPSPAYEGYYHLEEELYFKDVLQHYALDSLNFLLQEDALTCKGILKEHIALHEIILKTIKKASQA